MVGNEMSFNRPLSRRKLSSASTASISVSLPFGASRSSQARNRAIATPSRVCAARAPSISARFFTAFISVIGSAPRIGLPPLLDIHRVTRFVVELAAVDVKRGLAFGWNGREGECQRRMRYVGAAYVEGPGDVL